MNRKPVAAGLFYNSSFDKLDKEIKECFISKLGPGDFPVQRKNKKIFGIIAPHAGYKFSGPCASWAYKELAESKFPKTYIILGPNHTGLGAEFSTYLFADWETPFGAVKVDAELGKKLIKKFPLINEAEAHLEEHSIEVQLPFLQYVNKDKLNEIKFIPICIKSDNYKQLLNLAKAISELNEEICIICSSDFTHYGPNYNFVPFVHAVKDNIYRMDEKAIDLIKDFNSKEFYNYTKKLTICGKAPIIVAMEACRLLGAKKADLLSHYTSGDLSNYENAVGYASFVFK